MATPLNSNLLALETGNLSRNDMAQSGISQPNGSRSSKLVAANEGGDSCMHNSTPRGDSGGLSCTMQAERDSSGTQVTPVWRDFEARSDDEEVVALPESNVFHSVSTKQSSVTCPHRVGLIAKRGAPKITKQRRRRSSVGGCVLKMLNGALAMECIATLKPPSERKRSSCTACLQYASSSTPTLWPRDYPFSSPFATQHQNALCHPRLRGPPDLKTTFIASRSCYRSCPQT